MRRSIQTFVLLFALVALLTGCAGSAPRPKLAKAFPANFEIQKYKRFNPTVGFEDKDVTEKDAVERIRVEIIKALKKIEGQPFTEAAVTTVDADTLSVDVTITKYDGGDAFARAMLAGLGKIKINGVVRVREGTNAEPIAEYTVNKTFAWGGIYGAATRIEDVEQGFAEGVVQPIKDLIVKKKK